LRPRKIPKEETMKPFAWVGISAGIVALAIQISPDVTHAQNFNDRGCAWPLEISPEGSGNVQGPDGAARYWIMPFDTTQYTTMTIRGTYPNIRYFSFAAYETITTESVTSFNLAEERTLYDAQIAPDPGTVNPFVPPQDGHPGKRGAGSPNGTYTVLISSTAASSGNSIRVSSGALVWVVLRMYVADADPSLNGQTLMGGVPLPTLTLTSQSGASQKLSTCLPINKWQNASDFARFLLPPSLNLSVDEGTPSSDRLWFAPVLKPPPILWPNPDNKYMMMWPGNTYQSGRIIVIHGKAPGFPGTFENSPVWVPSQGFRTVDLRYWALCEQDLALPLSLIGCATDFNTNLVDGYYTIVISDDLVRPKWLRPEVNWLPYGDEQYPKFVVIRNMLPADDFSYAVQNAWPSCAFNLSFSSPPNRTAIDNAGPCAQGVMGDYYPIAAWCDKSAFITGGVRSCLKGW
jgi:hypothetical protein